MVLAKIYNFPVADSASGPSNIALTELGQGTATKGQDIEPDVKSGYDAIVSKGKLMEPIMPDYQEKYLDSRFAHIDDSIGEIRTDIRGIRNDIKNQIKWTIGTALVLAALIISLFTYHANVMQSQFNHHVSTTQAQMQSFSDYVKAVTQPQLPKVPQK